MRRRSMLLFALPLLVACGGGTTTRLHTKSPGKGDGPIHFSVVNGSDTAVNNLFMASSDAVRDAKQKKIAPGSAEDEAMWGGDLLSGALAPGQSADVAVQPGNWDFLAKDRDGREQNITHVKLAGGGTYALELGEGGWRAPK